MTIRYEDFLTDREAVLDRVCQFLGIDFLNSMMDVSNSNEAKNIADLSSLWQTNSSAPIPAYIDKFKQTMSMAEIEIIETIAGEYMNLFGYELMTPASANITTDAIATARKRTAPQKQQAWSELKHSDPRDYQLRKFRADYLEMVKQRLLEQQKEASTMFKASAMQNIA